MTYRDMALKLPESVRKEIIDKKMIETASPAGGDAMDFLFFTWYTMIDPTAPFDYSCALCRGTTLDNWKQIQPEIVKLERQGRVMGILKRLI